MPKTILITGTSSGFGELTAYQLADEGHIVYASMRGVTAENAEKAERRVLRTPKPTPSLLLTCPRFPGRRQIGV